MTLYWGGGQEMRDKQRGRIMTLTVDRQSILGRRTGDEGGVRRERE